MIQVRPPRTQIEVYFWRGDKITPWGYRVRAATGQISGVKRGYPHRGQALGAARKLARELGLRVVFFNLPRQRKGVRAGAVEELLWSPKSG